MERARRRRLSILQRFHSHKEPSNEEILWWLLEELLTERQLALFLLETRQVAASLAFQLARAYSASLEWTPPTNYSVAIANRAMYMSARAVLCTAKRLYIVLWLL